MPKYKIVNTSVANIYESDSFSSQLITQALLWEALNICDKKNNWYKVKQKDGYIGWIHEFYTIDSLIYDDNKLLQNHNNWFWVKDRFTSVLLKDNSKNFLSFGTILQCFLDKERCFSLLPNNERVAVNKSSLLKFSKKYPLKDIVSYAINLIGSPYLWGGKSSFGYDCSGFVQILYQMAGYLLPRDCNDQVKSKLLISINMNNIEVGNLVFFEENNFITHVGIFINQYEYLHSAGNVKINSINKASKNYDKSLFYKIKGFYKLKVL